MNNAKNLQEILEQLRLTEGGSFECNEAAIISECKLTETDHSGLTVKMLSIAGGFFATLAFLAFMAIAGLYKSDIGIILLGIAFIAVSIWLDKMYDKLITDTAGISLYVIGFILIGFGLDHLKVNQNTIAPILIILALATLVITQNYLLSFISVLIISGSILSLILFNKCYQTIHIYIAVIAISMTYWFLQEAKMLTAPKKIAALYEPVRIGLIFSLLTGLTFVGIKGWLNEPIRYIWLSSLATVLLILYLISILPIVRGSKNQSSKIGIYSASGLLLLLTAMAPAVLGSLLIILLCFFVNYKTGLVIGIIAFIYFISQYYYDLNFSLLTKSGILFSTGILFILFYLFTHKKIAANEKI